MTSPTKEVHPFYDFYRADAPTYRFGKHIKGLGDSSHRADRDDSKMLAGEVTALECLSYYFVLTYVIDIASRCLLLYIAKSHCFCLELKTV